MHFCYFLKKIFKMFSNLYQPIVFFVQTCERLTLGWLPFWKNRRNLCIYCNFLNDSFTIFLKFSASGRLRHPGLGLPLKCSPRTEIIFSKYWYIKLTLKVETIVIILFASNNLKIAKLSISTAYWIKFQLIIAS